MKQILLRFESNQNKSKQMKVIDVFDRFTSKAFSVKLDILESAVWALKIDINKKFFLIQQCFRL